MVFCIFLTCFWPFYLRCRQNLVIGPILTLIKCIWKENAGIEVWHFHWGLSLILNSVTGFIWKTFSAWAYHNKCLQRALFRRLIKETFAFHENVTPARPSLASLAWPVQPAWLASLAWLAWLAQQVSAMCWITGFGSRISTRWDTVACPWFWRVTVHSAKAWHECGSPIIPILMWSWFPVL